MAHSTRLLVLAVDRGEGLAGQANIVTMYQLCHQVSHTFTQTHTQNTALNICTVASLIKGHYRFTSHFVFAVDRDQPSMCYSKEVLSSTQHMWQ